MRDPYADCDTILFPANPKVGLTCFRVDHGKLYRWSGSAWEAIPVPVGKYWLDPHELTMKRMGKRGWVRLDRRGKDASHREGRGKEKGFQAVG